MDEKITAWIARDKHNVLTLFEEKPNKIIEFGWQPMGWWDTSKYEMVIPKELFPQVKWEDEKPTEVELTIKICK